MPSQKVLITGVGGYLGSIIAEHLLRAGYSVVGLDNLMYGEATLFHLCADPNRMKLRENARDAIRLVGVEHLRAGRGGRHPQPERPLRPVGA